MQRLLRIVLDPNDLRLHNVRAMSLAAWKKQLVRLGMQILCHRPYGTFRFWLGVGPHSRWQLRAGKALRRFADRVEAGLDFPTRWFSPFLISISQKPA